MAPSPHPTRTLDLIDRVERGDREAAYDLARLYRPENIRDFIDFVRPDEPPPPTWLFDALADAYTAWREQPAAR